MILRLHDYNITVILILIKSENLLAKNIIGQAFEQILKLILKVITSIWL